MSEPTTLRHELAIRYELGGRVTNEQLAEDRIEISALLQERFRAARFEFGTTLARWLAIRAYRVEEEKRHKIVKSRYTGERHCVKCGALVIGGSGRGYRVCEETTA